MSDITTAAAPAPATTEGTKKPVYKSRYTDLYERVSQVMQKMQKQQSESMREMAQAFKELQTRVQKLERDHAKHEARSARRKQNTGPEQSFQGVNQCKRVHAELIKFLNANAAHLGPVASLVRPIMSLNEVNRCILAIGKAVGVVVEVVQPTADKRTSSWFYVLTKTDTPAAAAFVASLRGLLVDLWPAGTEGQINMAEHIEIRKMSRYFKHLLTVDEESQKYVAERIEAKRREMATSASSDDEAAAAAAAAAPATLEPATVAPAAPEAAAAPAAAAESSAEDAGAPKKRKLVRKTTA